MRHPLYKGMKLKYQINEDVSNLNLICFYTFCSATYCNRGHLDKVAKSDYSKITNNEYIPRKLVVGQSAARNKTITYLKHMIWKICFLRKWNVSLDNVFMFETLHVTPRRHICLTQAAILSSTSNFFATIAAFCNIQQPQVKNRTNVYVFCLNWHNNGPLRKLGLSSVGSKGHICRLWLVDFDPCCRSRFVVIMIYK